MTDAATKEAVYSHALKWFPSIVPPGACGFSDLPFLDKQKALPWYNRSVEGGRSFSSSGTMGKPKRISWSEGEDAWYLSEKRELFSGFLDGCRDVFVSLGGGHNASTALRLFGEGYGEVYDAGLSPVEAQCSALERTTPEVLYCSPSILRQIMRRSGSRGHGGTKVRRIILNGEPVPPELREEIAAFYEIDARAVMDTYGTTEIGTVAYLCPVCARYHFMGRLLPEPVEPRTGLEGNRQILAVSSVKRTSFPVLRLVTFDVVEDLGRSSCRGVERDSMGRIVGRVDDVVNYGELFPLLDLAELIRRSCAGTRWLVFSHGGDVDVVVEGAEPAGFREELRALYPVHARMGELGLLDPIPLHFVPRFDAFLKRARVPPARGAKEGWRVVLERLDHTWLADCV